MSRSGWSPGLKAGTATKMVLNRVTTIAMARIGKVYKNLMVDVNTKASAKLLERGRRMVQTLTGRSPEESAELLDAADGRVKIALVMAALQVDRPEAQRRLATANGRVAQVIEAGEV